MRTQRRGLLAGFVERVATVLGQTEVIRMFGQMVDAIPPDRAGRRRALPRAWRGAPRARPTWRCPGLSEEERAYWARLFAKWKVDEPPPDFTERLLARVMAAMRARCPAAGAEAVELPDGGFSPKRCDAPSTAAMTAAPSTGVRPMLRVIRGGKATPPRSDDEEARPVKPVA